MGRRGRRGRRATRAAAIAAVIALLQLAALASPTYACACGALETLDTSSRIDVDGETALVRHDGETEDILLSFDMTTDSESAALVLPLPAQADLTLADTDTFEDLRERTRPIVREEWRVRGLQLPVIGGSANDGAGAAPTGGVDVLEQRDLGPFEVTQLTSDDTDALADWLGEHGYRVRDEIVDATAPYLDEGWVLAVVQLRPGAEGEGFDGEQQPVRARFPSDEMVYPMRLQAQAEDPMPLRVYTLTEHRTDLRLGEVDAELKFAGELAEGDVDEGSTLADLRVGTPYLTRFDTVVAPEEVTGDMTFTRHATDDAYREEQVVYRDLPWVVRIFVPSWGSALFWVAMSPLLVGGLVIVLLLRRLVRGARPR